VLQQQPAFPLVAFWHFLPAAAAAPKFVGQPIFPSANVTRASSAVARLRKSLPVLVRPNAMGTESPQLVADASYRRPALSRTPPAGTIEGMKEIIATMLLLMGLTVIVRWMCGRLFPIAFWDRRHGDGTGQEESNGQSELCATPSA
jgi:hypothetical protein